jgi:glycosyltransferase involved in cell wall biosynthesis
VTLPSSGKATLRALFLVENLPYDIDSRVRRETRSLRDSGLDVTVVCPADSRHDPRHFVEDGIHVYQYPVRDDSTGIFSYLTEYLTSLCWHTALAARVFFTRGFDVIHVANPPDLLWLVALPYNLLGKRLIYDHHDQVPELFTVKFGDGKPLLRWAMTFLEKVSFRLADHVISINESSRLLAINRGGKREEDVTVVRNGPRMEDFPEVSPDKVVRGLGSTVVGFLGCVNPQDDVDVFIEMARVIRKERKREDIGFVIVGSGTGWNRIRDLRDRYELQEAVLMTGRVPWEQALSALAAVDICVQPDLPNEFSNIATMNKLMEYMALGKACVSFDLLETRVSGGDAVVYAAQPTADCLADAVINLADDPEERTSLGESGRSRVAQQLAWHHQAPALISVYEKLFPGRLVPVLSLTPSPEGHVR